MKPGSSEAQPSAGSANGQVNGQAEHADHHHSKVVAPDGHKASLFALTLGSVGVVYGDIGTSPLYAFREALKAADQDGVLTRFEVFGVSSLILWALVLIVSVKYIFILLRADNNGEGGTLSLMALARRAFGGRSVLIFTLGVIAASLFYGDAVITPAISILGAIEGLKYVGPEGAQLPIDPYILPIALAIIVVLFAFQSGGTGRIGAAFGPITVVWFVTLALTGIAAIARAPSVLLAINPLYAVEFLAGHGRAGLIALGAVFLAVTGAEALYADLGHFGRRPIQLAWFFVVLPALALNYLGQAALVLSEPKAVQDPFFFLVPSLYRAPLVLIATAASVIASQAVITGAFSLSRQAIQLGLLPRLEVKHTSESLAGQIFMPQINRFLFIGVVTLVLAFGSSGRLASAYGIAVTGTMIVTALMAFVVIWKVWRWRPQFAAAIIAPFLAVEIVFLGANLLKIADGGWMPLALASCVFITMLTWSRGTRILQEKTRRSEVPLVQLLTSLQNSSMPRVPGTAVFLTADPSFAPTALMHNIKHNKVLHKQNIILTVRYADRPRVDPSERLTIARLTDEFVTIEILVGYMETPNVPRLLASCRKHGVSFEMLTSSFFLSRRSILSDPHSGMPRWQDKLFISLARNATSATEFFKIPTDRVVEVGTQVSV